MGRQDGERGRSTKPVISRHSHRISVPALVASSSLCSHGTRNLRRRLKANRLALPTGI